MRINRRHVLAAMVSSAAMPLTLSSAQSHDPLKVGFVYFGSIDDQGWTSAHERGRLALVEALGDELVTTHVQNVGVGDADRVMRELIERGNKLIFATSFGYMNAVAKLARAFPDVRFEHVSGSQRARNLATYNARFYEGRAVAGTLAGHMSKSGRCGYIAAFQLPDVVRGINAFTLAAQKVNPKFRTDVVWLNAWSDPQRQIEVAQKFVDSGTDILAQHADKALLLEVAQARGVYAIGQSAELPAAANAAFLTSLTYEWGEYYIARARAVLDGTWQPGDQWLGLKDGAIGIAPFGPKVSDVAAIAATSVRQQIGDGRQHPFSGPIFDQTGVERLGAGHVLEDSQILPMNWLVAGVKS
jgi:basic membrane protein A